MGETKRGKSDDYRMSSQILQIFADFRSAIEIKGFGPMGVADLCRNQGKPLLAAGNRRNPQSSGETGFSHLFPPFWRSPISWRGSMGVERFRS